MKTVKVRNYEIGSGQPGTIVPIVGKTKAEILEKAKSLCAYDISVVEWRVDFYEDVFDTEKRMDTLAALRESLGEMPLLFTFRTKQEGGEKEIDMETYTALNKAAAESGNADLIDVEILSGDAVVKENIEAIHAAGAYVVGSNHDFFATPDKEEIIRRLMKMQVLDADIPKIAVMPTCTEDVITLLAASAEMHEKHADRPIITMSMSAKGLISRLAGEVFGSSMSFGAVGQVSAPGQISVEDLNTALNILHQAVS